MERVETVKRIRIEADGINTCIRIDGGNLEKTKDAIRLGRAWLGKLLGAMGQISPYGNDGARETVADIEPAADQATSYTLGLASATEVAYVDELREQIAKTLIYPLKNVLVYKSKGEEECAKVAYLHFCEARFWLGYELERIKNEDIAKKLKR